MALYNTANQSRLASIEQQLEAKLKQNPRKIPFIVVPDESVGEPFSGRLYFLNKHEDKPRQLYCLPTRLSQDEAKEVIDKIGPFKKTMTIMAAIATSYEYRHMLIIEGGTSLGKSYGVNAVYKLMYGKNARPETFECDAEKDAADLFCKYAPNANDPAAIEVDRFRHSEEGKVWLKEQINQRILSASSEELRVIGEAAAHLGVSLNKNSFTVVLGAVTRAALGVVDEDGDLQADFNSPGKGSFVHLQELGLLKGKVAKTLMPLRGENAKYVDSYQLHQDGGRRVSIGENFFVVATTNTLKYADREPIETALGRFCDWERLGELDDFDIKEAAEYIFNYELGNKPDPLPHSCIIDLSLHEELRSIIRDVVCAFHKQFAPKVESGQAGGDRQAIPCTFDNMTKVAEAILGTQVLDGGVVDIVETVKRAIDRYYINTISESQRISERTIRDNLFSDTTGSGVIKTGRFSGKVPAVAIKEIIAEIISQASLQDDGLGVNSEDLEILRAIKSFNDTTVQIEKYISTIDATIQKGTSSEESIRNNLKNARGLLLENPNFDFPERKEMFFEFVGALVKPNFLSEDSWNEFVKKN